MMAQNQYWQANPAADLQPEYIQWPTASLQYQYPVPGKCRLLPVDFSYYSNPATEPPANVYGEEASVHPYYQAQAAVPCCAGTYGVSIAQPGGMPVRGQPQEYGLAADGALQYYQYGYQHWNNAAAIQEPVPEAAQMPAMGARRQGSMAYANPPSLGYAGWQYHQPQQARLPRVPRTAYLHRFDSASSNTGQSYRVKAGHPYLQGFQSCDQSTAEEAYHGEVDCGESPESLPSLAFSTCSTPCADAPWLDADLDPNQDAATLLARGVRGMAPASSERLREPRKKKQQPLRSMGVRRSLNQAFANAARAEEEATAKFSPGTPSSVVEQRAPSHAVSACCQDPSSSEPRQNHASEGPVSRRGGLQQAPAATSTLAADTSTQPSQEISTSGRRWLDALVHGKAAREAHPPVSQGLDRSAVSSGVEELAGKFVSDDEHTLRQLLDGGARVSAADACAVATNVAFALQRLHEDGLLFRDVCPENIVLGDAACVSTARLGQGADVALGGPFLSFSDCRLVGDSAYRPPEIILSQGKRFTYTAAGDVWSLGIVISELLSGRRPFSAQALVAAATMTDCPIEHLQSCLTRCLQREAASWPAGAFDLVNSLLQVDPVLRPSAAQMLDHPWLQASTPISQNTSDQANWIEEGWATVDLVSRPDAEAQLATTETAMQHLAVEPAEGPITPPAGVRASSAEASQAGRVAAAPQQDKDGKPNGVILNWVQHLFKRSRKGDPCFSGRTAAHSRIQRQATW